MSPSPLDLFSRQLAGWAEDLLQRSRSPLRKVDRLPELLTGLGTLQPDLVFWVNRDSCMAGGVVLIPELESDEVAVRGRNCAIALGLRHFVVWGAKEVTFWESRGESLSRYKCLAAPTAGSDVTVFRSTLTRVLDELKYLTVAGAIPPGELSPHYFANLCQVALADSAVPLTEAMRIARSEYSGGSDWLTPEGQAINKALLTLARVAALLFLDQLPGNVQPEGLERAMYFALDALPAELRSALIPAGNEPPLPPEVAVRFHHLLRRLTQLDGCRDHERLTDLLHLLMARHAREMGLVSFGTSPGEETSPELWVNACDGNGDCRGTFEVAVPAALAFSALLRRLREQPAASFQSSDVFDVPGHPAPKGVVATLLNPASVPGRDRALLQAKLRLSWPTRRFTLPSALPRWGWELLHLLGLAAPKARLQLRTPRGWFAAPFAQPLLDVMLAESEVSEIRLADGDHLDLLLSKSSKSDEPILIDRGEEQRRVDLRILRDAPASLWALATELPAELWGLIEEGLIQPPAAGPWPLDLEDGALHFAHSTMGRALWRVLGQGQALPDRKRLPTVLAAQRFPLPKHDVLLHLQHLGTTAGGAIPSPASIDAELKPWFEVAPRPAAPASPPLAKPKQGTDAVNYGALREILQREVFGDGLPVFPEHYLFAHFRPQLLEFSFILPLLRRGEFFGQVTFEDRAGQSFDVPSSEMAQALELIAGTGRQKATLPAAPHIMQDILNRYLHDLRALHSALHKRVHALVADPRQAQKTVRKLWDDSGLPNPESFLPKGK